MQPKITFQPSANLGYGSLAASRI